MQKLGISEQYFWENKLNEWVLALCKKQKK